MPHCSAAGYLTSILGNLQNNMHYNIFDWRKECLGLEKRKTE